MILWLELNIQTNVLKSVALSKLLTVRSLDCKHFERQLVTSLFG